MGRHVLVAIDGSPQSWAALECAIDLFANGDITALYVMDPLESVFAGNVHTTTEAKRIVEAAADDIVADVSDLIDDANATIEVRRQFGRPGTEIVRYIEDHDVDHLVMGSHGRTGIKRFLFGSVAESIARRSPVPVTIVR